MLFIIPVLFESLGSLDDFVLRKDCLSFLTSLCFSVLKKRQSEEVGVEVIKVLINSRNRSWYTTLKLNSILVQLLYKQNSNIKIYLKKDCF